MLVKICGITSMHDAEAAVEACNRQHVRPDGDGLAAVITYLLNHGVGGRVGAVLDGIDRASVVGDNDACALVDASGEEVPADEPERLGGVEAGHTMVLDRDALRSARPRAPQGAIVAREGSVRREVPLTAEPISVGRDPRNDIVLDDRRVSRRHAEVRLRLGRYTLYDLQSTNGTFVNGRRIAEMVLSDDDRISIGGAELVVRLEG